MASEFDASCENDPNFAVICAFLEKFGKQCGLPNIDFLELQQMLENSDEVPTNLYDILLKLLRKIKKTVKPDKWEKSLVAVTHTFSSVDAWEIERFGFKKAKLSSKVRVVKELLEMQFDYNVKFKNELNKLSADELRSQPLGRDKSGHSYWYHSDDNYQIRIYKEDLDDETWSLIAKDRTSLASLINKLSDGETKFSSDSAVNEDSSSLSEKPLIDTGQPESEKRDVNSDEKTNSNDSIESKLENGDNKDLKVVENQSSNNVEPKQDEPPRPMLRIKKLSELVDTGVKRQKFDDDEDEVTVTVSKIKSDIEGETISEPVMVIAGEGNGEDNESVNNRLLNGSPIVGEEIEEETFYIFGDGSGCDCLTGNEGKGESSEEKSVNSSVENINSFDDSIKNTVCETKDNKAEANEVVSNNSDATVEKKTDSNLDSTECSKNANELNAKTETTLPAEYASDEPKSPVPKKSMFFFGSPLKNTSFSPSAKVEFGQVSPKSKESCEVKPNNDNNNEVEKIEEKTKESVERSNEIEENKEEMMENEGNTKENEDKTKEHEEKTKEHEEKTKENEEKTKEHEEKTKVHEEKMKEHEEETKEHEEETKEHVEKTKEHEEKMKENEEETKEHEEETKEHEEKTKEHEEETKKHEEEMKEHEEETKEHEEKTKEHEEKTKEHEEKTKENKEKTKENEEKTKENAKTKENEEKMKAIESKEPKLPSVDINSGHLKQSNTKKELPTTSNQELIQNEKSESVPVEKKTNDKLDSINKDENIKDNVTAEGHHEVKEDLCIKTVAYQCGKSKKNHEDNSCEVKTTDTADKVEKLCVKEVAYKCGDEKPSKSPERVEGQSSIVESEDGERNNQKVVTLKKPSEKDLSYKDVTFEKTTSETISHENVTLEKLPQKELISEKTSQKDGTSENTSQKDISSQKSPQEEAVSEKTSQKDVLPQKTSQKDGSSEKPPQKVAVSEKTKIENKAPEKKEQTLSKIELLKSNTASKGIKETPKPIRSQNINTAKSPATTPAAAAAAAARAIKDNQLHNSLRYFRTRRTANVKMTNEVRIPIRNIDPVMLAAQRVGVSVAPKKPVVETPPKVSTEVVYVQDRKGKSKKEREITSAASQKNNKKPKLTSDEVERGNQLSKKDEAKTNSSISSPMSAPDSIMTLPDSLENSADVPEKDPLADSEVEEKSAPKPVNMTSLSFDYNSSSTPPPMPVIPSRRVLRKRGREASPEPAKIVVNESKKMKMKGKRVNTNLRKSIEEKKEQQASSSDEVHVSPPKPSKKTPKKKQKPKSKKQPQKKQVKAKNESIDITDNESEEDDSECTKKNSNQETKNKKATSEAAELSGDDSNSTPKPKSKGKNTRILAGLEISECDLQPIGVRQSRRLAQIKIKEQVEPKKPEPKLEKPKKKPEVIQKELVLEKRKRTKAVDLIVAQVPEAQEEKKKKKRKKQKDFSSKSFDETKVWQSSSESSEADEEIEEEEEVIEEYEPPLEFKSDHEFSPESDIGSDTEYQPMKRARTARKNKETDQEEEEEFPCQKCGKSDHPEWILLCDKCDNGWHCSCLRPPLLNIPEGEWHCPPCQHILLVENLQKKLEEYDKQLNKKVLEDRRKERLAYVGISLNNVLPSRENEHRKKKRRHSVEESEYESVSEKSRYSDGTESESDSDEPIYQLRQRRQAKSYKFNEYDELIKSAIQDEMEEVEHTKASQSRGKDMATIVKAEEDERKEKEIAEAKPEGEIKPNTPDDANSDSKKKEYSDDDEPIRPPVRRGRKKKGRKMTNLDSGSEEDDEKDEDFKGSSSSSEEEDFEEEESDDDSDYISAKRKKNLRPVRRSTRVRVSRFDADFINDDDDDEYPKKKKKKQMWSETESSDTDGSWNKKKKKGRSEHIKKRKSRKKNSILDELSDLEIKRKPKIKYGGLTSSDEDTGRRRTRGKKTTYVDTLGSDSEEERKKRNPHRYIDSDDENDEDFVANEEEEEEKDSEEAPEEEEDKQKVDEDDDEDKDEQEERRPLVIPKIYIKKPPVCKEILPSHVNSATKEPVKIVETPTVDQEKVEIVEKVEKIVAPEKPNDVAEKPKIEITAANNISETVTPEPVRNFPILPPSIRITKTIVKEKEEPPVVVEDKVVVKVETQMEEDLPPPIKPVELTAMEIEQEKKRRALEEAKRLLGSSNSIEIVPIKRGRKPSEPPTKIISHDLPSKFPIQEPLSKMPIHELPTKIFSHERTSKIHIHEPPSKLSIHEPPSKKPIHELIPKMPLHEQLTKIPVRELQTKVSTHEPIVSNVDAFIHNDESNDELSEPPSVTLPMFEELATKNGTGVRRKIGKGRPKKTIEEAVANLGGMKKDSTIKVKSESELCIEIAAPPQPFSQASPVPSVITRMLQTSPGQTSAFPVGKIRPKQFATMPADDDDDEPPLPNRSRGGSPQTGPHYSSPHMGQFLSGSPRGGSVNPPYGQMHPNMNPYPRGILSPHQMRGPRPPMSSHMYPPHRMMEPMSVEGPLNMSDPSSQHPTSTSAPNMKTDSQIYSRPPSGRYPPISTPSSQARTSPRPPQNVINHMPQPRPTSMSPYPQQQAAGSAGPPPNYYGNYPHSEPLSASEDAMPPSAYQGSPYPEEYAGEGPREPSENSNSKSYGGETEEAGEFGGLVSYFSSQREDDLDS